MLRCKAAVVMLLPIAVTAGAKVKVSPVNSMSDAGANRLELAHFSRERMSVPPRYAPVSHASSAITVSDTIPTSIAGRMPLVRKRL